MLKRLVIIFTCLIIAACATAGRPIPEESINKLEVGVTTPADATRMFGKPVATAKNSDGSIVLSWAYVKVSAFATANQDTLTATFGESGVLSSYTSSSVSP